MLAHRWLDMILYIYADTDATGSFYNNEMFVWRVARAKGLALCPVADDMLPTLPVRVPAITITAAAAAAAATTITTITTLYYYLYYYYYYLFLLPPPPPPPPPAFACVPDFDIDCAPRRARARTRRRMLRATPCRRVRMPGEGGV